MKTSNAVDTQATVGAAFCGSLQDGESSLNTFTVASFICGTSRMDNHMLSILNVPGAYSHVEHQFSPNRATA